VKHKKFTKKQTNKFCTELYSGCANYTKDKAFIFKIIRDNEIELLHVDKLITRRFWLASTRRKDNDKYTNIHYEHDDLGMAVLGAFLYSKGFKP